MIKLLFHFGGGELRSSSVVLFFGVFITLQCVTSGVWVSNGQFIPSILAGAAMGETCPRLFSDIREAFRIVVVCAHGVAASSQTTLSCTGCTVHSAAKFGDVSGNGRKKLYACQHTVYCRFQVQSGWLTLLCTEPCRRCLCVVWLIRIQIWIKTKVLHTASRFESSDTSIFFTVKMLAQRPCASEERAKVVILRNVCISTATNLIPCVRRPGHRRNSRKKLSSICPRRGCWYSRRDHANDAQRDGHDGGSVWVGLGESALG